MIPDRIVRCELEPNKAAPVGFCDCGACCRKRHRAWEKLCEQVEAVPAKDLAVALAIAIDKEECTDGAVPSMASP